MYAVAARPGIIVVDSNLTLLASNPDAVQILTFPDNPNRIPEFDKWVTNRLRTRLLDRRSENPAGFVAQFRSAKRIYTCRSFPLNVRVETATPVIPAVLLLLERTSNGKTPESNQPKKIAHPRAKKDRWVEQRTEWRQKRMGRLRNSGPVWLAKTIGEGPMYLPVVPTAELEGSVPKL